MTIGEKIKQRRKELKITVEELARRLGKYRSTVYRYENGDIENMPLDVLEPIAEALETTPQYLMGWEEVQKNNDAIADIVVRLRSDETFFNAVQRLEKMDTDQLSSLLTLLK